MFRSPRTNRTAIKLAACFTILMVCSMYFHGEILIKPSRTVVIFDDPYEKDFLNCKPSPSVDKCGKNETLIPDKMCYDSPAQQYPSCGMPGFLKPKIDDFEDDEMWMVFFVKSSIPNIQKRDRIRRTWGTVRKIKNKKFMTIFLIGGVKDQEQMQFLQQENNMYNDMLQCLAEDTYYNLPFKVLSSFRWILATGLKAKYYSFCDDDVVMHMANIFVYYTELERKEPDNEDVICGYHMTWDPKEEVAHRGNDTKWSLPESIYDKPTFPKNCWGQLWTVSQQRISDLYCAAEVTNTTGFFIDDVLITGILRNKLTGDYEKGIHLPILEEKDPMELCFYPLDIEDKWEKNRMLDAKWPYYNRLLNEHYFLPETSNSKIKIKMRDVVYNMDARRTNIDHIVAKWQRYQRIRENRLSYKTKTSR